jgi:hypothetical protein
VRAWGAQPLSLWLDLSSHREIGFHGCRCFICGRVHVEELTVVRSGDVSVEEGMYGFCEFAVWVHFDVFFDDGADEDFAAGVVFAALGTGAGFGLFDLGV